MSAPWKDPAAKTWKGAIGIGRYRVLDEEPTKRLRLVRADRRRSSHPDPDTLTIRFERGAPRARTLLRAQRPDLVWPLPPGLLDEPLPPGYQRAIHDAEPQRVLLLVMRADVPPTTKLATRHALAHAVNRGELVRALGPVGEDLDVWLRGADRFEFPKLDGDEVQRWLEQGKLGRSFHVVMAYDADGPAASVARIMQGGWARLSIYVELRPLRGKAALAEALRGGSHLVLVDNQSLLDDPAAELAGLVMPLRGPAVGSFRTGWRTREFDAWLNRGVSGFVNPAAHAQRRLEEELVALPLARLPWIWVEREGAAAARLHPHFGPECAAPAGGTARR